ncbi:MAG: hypothetical protein CMM45_10055 [Rhodospirillaceae bacterium]|nr:hypothetical protein [Rhodospirillaceae bacterium]
MGRGHAGRLEYLPSVVSSEAKVTILKRDCRRLLRKKECANVAFKPGVDVSENKVTGTFFTGTKKSNVLGSSPSISTLISRKNMGCNLRK